jgi:hypothetical protein
MQSVRVLRNKMFDPPLFEQRGDGHMGEGWLGDVHQSVYGSLVGGSIGEVAVPQSWASADDGLLPRAVVGDADGGGYACTGEDDRMGGSAEGRSELLDLLLNLPVGVDDLFGLELGKERS